MKDKQKGSQTVWWRTGKHRGDHSVILLSSLMESLIGIRHDRAMTRVSFKQGLNSTAFILKIKRFQPNIFSIFECNERNKIGNYGKIKLWNIGTNTLNRTYVTLYKYCISNCIFILAPNFHFTLVLYVRNKT